MAEGGGADTEPYATFTVRRTDDGTHVVVGGEIDVATAPGLKAQCVQALHERPERLVIDLGQVTFCDSSGLHALLFIRVEGEALGVPVVVGDVSSQALRILELSGLTEYLRGESPPN